MLTVLALVACLRAGGGLASAVAGGMEPCCAHEEAPRVDGAHVESPGRSDTLPEDPSPPGCDDCLCCHTQALAPTTASTVGGPAWRDQAWPPGVSASLATGVPSEVFRPPAALPSRV